MIFTPDEKISMCLRLCTKSRSLYIQISITYLVDQGHSIYRSLLLFSLINSLHFKGTHRPNREYHPIQEIVLHNLGVLGNQIFIKLLDFMKIKCSLNWQIFNVICRDSESKRCIILKHQVTENVLKDYYYYFNLYFTFLKKSFRLIKILTQTL